jgi:hypothetical protein
MTRASANCVLLAFACASLALAGEACSNDTPATGGNQPGQPGTTIGGGDGGTLDSGKTNAEAGTDSGVVIVDAGPALCDPSFSWTAEGALSSLVSSNMSQFGAVSGTELALAWTTSTGDVYVADRTNATTTFSTANKANGATALATDRVALSPTGNTIIAVAADRKSFVELDRSTVGGAWTVGSTDPYANINSLFSEGSGAFAEPVIGADKNVLFFIATVGTNPPFLYESRYNTTLNVWAEPNGILQTNLRSTDAAHLRRPTGLSADRRTLFFHDGTLAVPIERAAWRDTPDVAFTQFVDLTGFDEAAPNPKCETLYYQGAGPAVFTAD